MVLTPQPRPSGPPAARQKRLSLGGRGEALAGLAQGLLDVLIIGGGITGCGVALECAARGLSTGLVEARDFGGGTSSRSTKLIHGGLRYLRHFEFDLVQEAAHERRRLGQLAPGLVSEFPFVLPFYGGPWSAAQLRVGLSTYDLMGGFGGHSRNVGVSQEQLRTRFAPLLNGGARGAYSTLTPSLTMPGSPSRSPRPRPRSARGWQITCRFRRSNRPPAITGWSSATASAPRSTRCAPAGWSWRRGYGWTN